MDVVNPKGPLPAEIYWRRRLLVLGAVVVVVLGLGMLLTGEDDAEGASDEDGSGTPDTTAAAADSKSRDQAGDRKADRRKQRAAKKRAEQRKAARARAVSTSLDPPSGACDPGNIEVLPDVLDSRAFRTVPLRIGVSTIGAACMFEFNPDTVALQITSGSDLIWESKACESALPSESVVVRPGWVSYVTFDWTGRRATENCSTGNEFAQPGYYWIEGAAFGGEAARSQFRLAEPPPKPEPKKQKTADAEKTDEKPSDAETDEKPSDEESSDAEQSDEPVNSRREG